MKNLWWAIFAWMVDFALQNEWILHRVNKEDSDTSYSLLAFDREVVNTTLLKYSLRILAKGTLVILQSKTYHPMSNMMVLDTNGYPQGVVVWSVRLIYVTNALKLSTVTSLLMFIDTYWNTNLIVDILDADRTLTLSKVVSICKTLYQ